MFVVHDMYSITFIFQDLRLINLGLITIQGFHFVTFKVKALHIAGPCPKKRMIGQKYLLPNFRYREQVEGITPPDPELHELYMDLEPHLGSPLSVQARFQLNLVIRKDPGFPPLANLNESVTVVPMFWAQEGYR